MESEDNLGLFNSSYEQFCDSLDAVTEMLQDRFGSGVKRKFNARIKSRITAPTGSFKSVTTANIIYITEDTVEQLSHNIRTLFAVLMLRHLLPVLPQIHQL